MKSRQNALRALAVCLCLTLTTIAVGSPTYSGSLTSANGGVTATGLWGSDPANPVVFSWTVTQNAGSWNYHYTLQVSAAQGQISHMIIETSDGFDSSDVIGTPIVTQGTVGSLEYGSFTEDPGAIHGIKFDSTTGMTLEVSFDSLRTPVWGDFYAKNGKAGGLGWNGAWNTGFAVSDPGAGPTNGSIDNHILVPDTTAIPSPSAAALAGIGLCCVNCLRRLKTI